MELSGQEISQIITEIQRLQFDAPSRRVEEFIGNVLHLNQLQLGQYFPSPDPVGLLEKAVATLTGLREKMLRVNCVVPDFCVYIDIHGKYQVSGLGTYLALKKVDIKLRTRLSKHKEIRAVLRRMRNGYHFEALAAAIMNSKLDFGEATKGSGDQGVDAIGWNRLMLIDPSFSEGDLKKDLVLPGEKVFLFASSKAFTDGLENIPKSINPAHIRELVGGWTIQRSSVGKWQSVGIRLLTPVQMILVTTYRLSNDAKSECRALGVQVWGIPELIYLICDSAPDFVFDDANGGSFNKACFSKWWKVREQTRMMTSAV